VVVQGRKDQHTLLIVSLAPSEYAMKYAEAIKLLRIREIKFRAKSMTPEWLVATSNSESDYAIYTQQINLIHAIHATDVATPAQQLEWRKLTRLRTQPTPNQQLEP